MSPRRRSRPSMGRSRPGSNPPTNPPQPSQPNHGLDDPGQSARGAGGVSNGAHRRRSCRPRGLRTRHRHRHPRWHVRPGDRSQPRRGRTDPRYRDHPRRIRRGPRRPGDRRRSPRDLHLDAKRHGEAIVDLLSVAVSAGHEAVRLNATEALFQINLFQVIIAAANFVLFLAIIWKFAFNPIAKILTDRKARIEEGLRDAEQARRDRDSAESERVAALQEARREANEILARAQKVAQETRDADIAATKADLERMRERAAAEIESEKVRAITEVRNEVADLALRAAGKVVGETMTGEREKRLVSEFLAETSGPAGGSSS